MWQSVRIAVDVTEFKRHAGGTTFKERLAVLACMCAKLVRPTGRRWWAHFPIPSAIRSDDAPRPTTATTTATAEGRVLPQPQREAPGTGETLTRVTRRHVGDEGHSGSVWIGRTRRLCYHSLKRRARLAAETQPRSITRRQQEQCLQNALYCPEKTQ